MKSNIYNYNFQEFKKICIENNMKSFLATQVYDWLYKKNVNAFIEMKNISKESMKWLEENFYILNLKEKIVKEDLDGTIKFLLELEDGNKIETVVMNFDYGNSVCVTTQIGCNMGCKFCASGQLKKIRDLTAGEIIAQIQTANRFLISKSKDKIKNIVVMGIGEPFDNYENLKTFLQIANDDRGLMIGSRKITVSTCGILNKFDQWIEDFPQVGLAISLHASNDIKRSKIMPINNAFNINDIILNVNNYINKTNRRVTFEYILLKDINDSIDDAIELAELLAGMLCYVNLIPYNNVDGNDFKRSVKVRQFYEILRESGITATVRQEKGINIDGACGQLRAKNEKEV